VVGDRGAERTARPTGWLSFALYPFFLIWLVPATVIMMKRAGGTDAPAEARAPARTTTSPPSRAY
jgi:hypothetical protein